MVRFKNRHLLVEFLTPSTQSPSFSPTGSLPAHHASHSLDNPGKDEDDELTPIPPLPFLVPHHDASTTRLKLGDDSGSIIFRAIRTTIQEVFGDEGWGRVASSFKGSFIHPTIHPSFPRSPPLSPHRPSPHPLPPLPPSLPAPHLPQHPPSAELIASQIETKDTRSDLPLPSNNTHNPPNSSTTLPHHLGCSHAPQLDKWSGGVTEGDRGERDDQEVTE